MMISLYDYYKLKEINEVLWKALKIANANYDCFEEKSEVYMKLRNKALHLQYEYDKERLKNY